MNIAFLYNSDHESLSYSYGDAVMERILGAQVLQAVDRRMRVSVGDVLTLGIASESSTPTRAFLVKVCQSVYRPTQIDRLLYKRLEGTHGKATVYCWMFQNMTIEIAEALHSILLPDPAYLGAMDVNFSRPIHLRLFRNSLCENYRLDGNRCSIFYHMGENEDPVLSVRECFEQYGFSVEYEDIGARRSIFDNYDTPEHFKRVEDFKRVFTKMSGLDEEKTSDLSHSLEEIHPKLFDALASAARVLERAETEEDYAQAALSGRRLLEKTADYIFPPRDDLWEGHLVGAAQYRNRLWAYIEQTTANSKDADPDALKKLGKEADRLVVLFNSGLHAQPTREKVEEAFEDLLIWLINVIGLSPADSQKPNLAYDHEFMKLFESIIKRGEQA